ARPDRPDQAADRDPDPGDDQTCAREMEQWNRRTERDDHAGGGREVAVPRAFGRAELLQAEDEKNRRQQVGQRDRNSHGPSLRREIRWPGGPDARRGRAPERARTSRAPRAVVARG